MQSPPAGGKYCKKNKDTNHSLINRVSGFVWEDAGGQAGHNFLHAKLVSCLQHIVIDVDVVSLKEDTISDF